MHNAWIVAAIQFMLIIKNEEDRLEAAKRAAELFNTGKVLKSNPGE